MSVPQNRIITLTSKGCTAADEGGHVLGCIACGARAITELPEGFHKVSVVLTEGEFADLRTDAALSARGTWSEAIRKRLGLSPSPYGIYAAIARMNQPVNNEE